ncbi:amidohydrolase [uncultured Sphingomonas sp.]|uniref:amidohydrolase n=1 Tax=uncultured Sphingomonas sp. TaxID=158754 RepID=UPI0025E71C12|nr:amidohydrolase [uncultured Sphingomonas sp.]
MPSFRRYVRHSVRAWAPLAAIACASVTTCLPAQGAAPADLILTGARVYTVDDAKPWAEAVAVRAGRIVAVGTVRQVAAYRGPATRMVDLHGRFLMPAFGDAHVHPVFGGLGYARCSLHTGKSVDDYRRTIAACIAKTPGTGAVYGVGWEDGLFPPNGIPNKRILDALSTDRPLIFASTGGHSLWVNSKALALAGITRDTPDPVNGKIDRDPTTGEPVGGLEESAMQLVDKLVPPPTDADREGAIAYTAKLFNSLGITSWHDAMLEWQTGGTSLDLNAYKAVKDRGALTVHTVLDIKWDNGRGFEQMADIVKLSADARGKGLTANGVKFFMDGVIPQQTAAMLAPYEGTNVKGETQISAARLKEAVADLEKRGMQSHFHAIGDGAVRQALDAVAAAHGGAASDTRPMISHLNVIDPADQARFGKLGVAAIFQPLWACNEPYMALMLERIGPVRTRYVYPEAGVLKGGGRIAYGADWSVASANPLEGIEVALTRVAPGGSLPPLLPEQAVSLESALKAYTINVAYVNHLEKVTGSITVGKSADLVVLDQDLFRIKPAAIHTTKVVATIFQGREVYGSLDTPAR